MTGIVVWDVLIGIYHQSREPYDASHAFRDVGDGLFQLVCDDHVWLGPTSVDTGGRLQSHVPEPPLCPTCARIVGVRIVEPR